MTIEWKLVPVEPTIEMLSVMHERVLISVDVRKKETNILNDKAWWAAVVEAAPQPPALGGELEVVGYRVIVQGADHFRDSPACGRGVKCLALIDHAHVAPLLADIESERTLRRNFAVHIHELKDELKDVQAERDTLKAQLEKVREIADERAKGYASREHGGVLNGRCMDKVCALFEAAPAAKDGES